jgi:hypothetical protein
MRYSEPKYNYHKVLYFFYEGRLAKDQLSRSWVLLSGGSRTNLQLAPQVSDLLYAKLHQSEKLEETAFISLHIM